MVKNRIRIADHIAEIRHLEDSILKHYQKACTSDEYEKLNELWENLIECLKNLNERTA